jgi:hypothetical protein
VRRGRLKLREFGNIYLDKAKMATHPNFDRQNFAYRNQVAIDTYV